MPLSSPAALHHIESDQPFLDVFTMPIPFTDHRIRLFKTAFVIYYHTNMVRIRAFLLDFGLSITEERSGGNEIFFKGYGVEPFCYVARQATSTNSSFGGAAYVVESRQELERAAKIPGASNILELSGPGGGEIVSLCDPAGHQIHLVWGQVEEKPTPPPLSLEKLVVNFEVEKPRRGKFQRFQRGSPAPVHRWGHYGVTYAEGQYHQILDWYTTNFALAASDVVYVNEKPITCFLHIDRGEEFSDHHAFFIKRAKPGEKPSVAHAAFEVHDFDIQQLGHDHLKSRGYKLCWGVGRVSNPTCVLWLSPFRFFEDA